MLSHPARKAPVRYYSKSRLKNIHSGFLWWETRWNTHDKIAKKKLNNIQDGVPVLMNMRWRSHVGVRRTKSIISNTSWGTWEIKRHPVPQEGYLHRHAKRISCTSRLAPHWVHIPQLRCREAHAAKNHHQKPRTGKGFEKGKAVSPSCGVWWLIWPGHYLIVLFNDKNSSIFRSRTHECEYFGDVLWEVQSKRMLSRP